MPSLRQDVLPTQAISARSQPRRGSRYGAMMELRLKSHICYGFIGYNSIAAICLKLLGNTFRFSFAVAELSGCTEVGSYKDLCARP